MNRFIITVGIALCSVNSYSQPIRLDRNRLEAVNESMPIEKIMGKDVARAIKNSNLKESDEPTFIKIKGINFKNGEIKVMVLSRLLKNAPDFARGFIGVAFRINDSNTKFESIYIRPVNQE